MDYYYGNAGASELRCAFGESSDFWLLGSKISFDSDGETPSSTSTPTRKHTPQGQELQHTLSSLLWMSYRSGWAESISGFSTDAGWGCMYRSAQMMLANLLLKHISPSDSSSSPFTSTLPKPTNENYQTIVRLFADHKNSPYSMQNLVPLAELILRRKSGEWIAPSEALQILSISLQQHPNHYHAPLFPFMVRDGLMFMEEVIEMSKEYGQGEFCPTLVSVPIRLGLDQLNDVYVESVKKVFRLPQHVGIIGGQPRSSFFFIGAQEDSLFYLDPHTVQLTPNLVGDAEEGSKLGAEDLKTFFPIYVGKISITAIDPSMALCFYCPTQTSLEELVDTVQSDPDLNKLFSVEKKRGAGYGEGDDDDVCGEFDMDDFKAEKAKPKTVIIGDDDGDDDEFVLM